MDKDQRVLVLAEVTRVLLEKDIPKGTLDVTKVYVGPADIRGSTFVITSSRTSMDFTGMKIFPPLSKGERGIWLLILEKGGKLALGERRKWGVSWPARKGISARYSEVERLSEMLSSVYQAKADQQDALLKQYAVSTTPEMSAAAVRLSAEMQPDRVKETMEGLLKKELPPSGLVVLDKILSRADSNWPISSQRQEMLQKLVNSEMSSEEANRVLERISESWQRNETKSEVTLDLMKRAASNTSFPPTSRQKALFHIAWMAAQATRNDGETARELSAASFSIVVAIIKESKEDVALRIAAVNALGIIPFEQQRLIEMKSLQSSIESSEVKEAIRSAIRRIEQAQKDQERRKQTTTKPAQ